MVGFRADRAASFRSDHQKNGFSGATNGGVLVFSGVDVKQGQANS